MPYPFDSVVNLIGNPRDFSLEHRIFNSMMLIIGSSGVLITVYNVLFHILLVQIFMTVLFGIVGGGAYIFSIKYKEFKNLVLPTSVYFYIVLAFSWFATFGSQGSMGFYFFIFVTYNVVYFSKDIRIFLPFIIVYTAVLLFAEYKFPNLLFKYDSDFQQFIDVGLSMIFCLVINILVIHYIYKEYVSERVIKDSLLKQAIRDKEEIEKAYKEIRILKGCLPICASCKKIRNESGNWDQLEDYLSVHTEAKLSHGICPDCITKLYPELYPERN